MQAFILLIKEENKASKIVRHHLHESGGRKKKNPHTPQPNPEVLIKSSVDSKPEKREKAPDFNEGRL